MKTAELAGAIGILFLLIASAVMIEHFGYNRGVAERDAYYAPILRRAAQAKIAADQRAADAEERSVEINTNLEAEHANAEQILRARATDAESRISDLLRQHAAYIARRYQPVPTIPLAPVGGPGQATGPERDDRLAESVSTVGGACEHDADALARWQEWYSRQRSSLNQPTKGTP